MIVQPDFPEHWKTRLLAELTGDESAPMAVIRLWAHCQHSKRDAFPDMTPAQLASICRWNDRKPPCHTALIKAKFVEKLTPGGFKVHQWVEHNAQLVQKWNAGQKGGRPPTTENPNENGVSEKPTDNRPLTGPVPDRLDRPDRPDRFDKSDQTRPDQPEGPPQSGSAVTQSPPPGMDSEINSLGAGGLDGLTKGLTQKLGSTAGAPTLEDALHFGKQHYPKIWDHAEAWVKSWHKAMTKQRWQDRNRQPIAQWDRNLIGYCDKCWREMRKAA